MPRLDGRDFIHARLLPGRYQLGGIAAGRMIRRGLPHRPGRQPFFTYGFRLQLGDERAFYTRHVAATKEHGDVALRPVRQHASGSVSTSATRNHIDASSTSRRAFMRTAPGNVRAVSICAHFL